ncbi:DUF3515 domain-containing protein [Streptomyces chromofuscus]|uniref:DUF3515 domain-containing protein n=1 Tax=Streptomyces chromofuscus TaxID=42881 RepID=A0A7M2T6I1_STRCW|nr:DUF3515 domain-containing protein [Streptomyces chromofuscus]QOV43268.1 DUF3515 domain-containing protein [Streptomyces chromofuscus]GGT29944.1 hypothetical protein GCM10010254_58250 [Streptomyces chromofuscus]
MKISRHRLIGLPASALLIAVVGCSSADDSASVAVPSPSAAVTELCRNLDKALPRTVDGLSRNDPEPESALTAGWGSPVIILRCGVARPPKMTDPKVAEGRDSDAVAGGVNGVDWLQEERDGGGYRFTSANRRAYVEVTVPEGRDNAAVLVDLASAVRSAIPEGIAD